MRVYEGDDRPDRYGKHPIRFTGYKSIEEVYEWLFYHYNGYQFVIMLNVSGDEFEPLGRELLVYFSDEVLDEIAAFHNYEIKKMR